MIQSLRLLSADKTIELGLFRTRDEDSFKVLLYYTDHRLYDHIVSLNGTVKLVNAFFEDSIVNSTYIESYGTFNQFPSKTYSASNPKTLSFDLKLNDAYNNSSFAVKSVFEYILYNSRAINNPSSGYFYFMAIDNEVGDYQYSIPGVSQTDPKYRSFIYVGKACCTDFDNQIYSDNVIYSVQSSVLKCKTIKNINFGDIMIQRLKSLISNYDNLEYDYKSTNMLPVDHSFNVNWDDRIVHSSTESIADRIRLINTIQPPSKFLQRVGTEINNDNYAFYLFRNEDCLPNNVKITFNNPGIKTYIYSYYWLSNYNYTGISITKPKIYINGCEFSIGIQNEILNNLPFFEGSSHAPTLNINNISLLLSKDINGKIECSSYIEYCWVLGEDEQIEVTQKCSVDIVGTTDNIFQPGWIMLSNEISNVPDSFNIDAFNASNPRNLLFETFGNIYLTVEGGR